MMSTWMRRTRNKRLSSNSSTY